MKINPLNFKSFKNTNQRRLYLPLRPLRGDCVSFSSMKKTQFSRLDLMVVNKFKAPIEKFNNNDDFQKWCFDKLNNEYILQKSKICSSNNMQARFQKEDTLDNWINYVTIENETYKPALQLLIISSIASNIDYNTNKMPPALDEDVLADTISEMNDNCKKDKNYNVNFYKLYTSKLFQKTITEHNLDDIEQTGWAVIPSKENDPDNFDDNVKKLQTLSCKSWCTRSYNAKLYLTDGDFQIYFENGVPKLGMGFGENQILSIQGEENDSRIPLKYLDAIKSYINKKGYKLSSFAKFQIDAAEKVRAEINQLENKLKQQGVDFKTCSTKQLFDVLGFKYKENKDGLLVLEKYSQPSEDYSFTDLGTDENILLKDVVEIEKDADFYRSDATNLGSIVRIKGNADFNNSKIVNLANLEAIEGSANFSCCAVTSLKKLQTIGGNAEFGHSQISDLGNLKYIGKDAEFTNARKITSLNHLQVVGGNLILRSSNVEDLGELKTVKGNIDIEYTEAKELGIEKLKSICPNF